MSSEHNHAIISLSDYRREDMAMNGQHPMNGENSPLHTQSIQGIASAIHKKLLGSHDPDIVALKGSFENLTCGIGLQTEENTRKEENNWHTIIFFIIYLITLLVSVFKGVDKTNDGNDTIDDVEQTIDEKINCFEASLHTYNYDSDEAKEILAMIKSFLEMVRPSILGSNSNTPIHQHISNIESDSFDDYVSISDVNLSSTSLLSNLSISDDESFVTSNDSLSERAFPTKESNIEEYALVSVYQDEILLSLDRETFYQMVDELVKTNINRLKTDEINIPGNIENELSPMLVDLKNILHDYKSEESWALQYRKQKRKIAKLIHPDRQKNKKAAALIAPIIIHSLFEGIDKLIERLDSNKLLNTYDAEVESFFKDIWQSMKESAEKMKWIEKQIKEMTVFHQEASDQIEKMGEEIKQISADYRRMFEETKKANKAMEEILKRQDIIIEKAKASSKEVEMALEESKRYRLMNDIRMYHSKKEFVANNKSIQASKDNIYKKLSMMDAILDKREITAFEDISNDSPPNPHQFFTGQISGANQYPEASHHIAKNSVTSTNQR